MIELSTGNLIGATFIAIGIGVIIAVVTAYLTTRHITENMVDSDDLHGVIERGTEYLVGHIGDVLEQTEALGRSMATIDDIENATKKIEYTIASTPIPNANLELESDVNTLTKRLDKHGQVIRSLQSDTDRLIAATFTPDTPETKVIPIIVSSKEE